MSSSEFFSIYRFGMALGSLSFGAQGCVPALLENWHGVCLTLELVGSWVVFSFSVSIEAFG